MKFGHNFGWKGACPLSGAITQQIIDVLMFVKHINDIISQAQMQKVSNFGIRKSQNANLSKYFQIPT